MGAHSFTATAKETDPRKAYESLVGDALSQYGSDSYNGTISTTRGFRVHSSVPLSPLAAEVLSNSRLSSLEKWGDCEAIAVGTAKKTKEKTVTITIRPTGPVGQYLNLTAAEVAAKIGVTLERLESFTVLESTPAYRYRTTKAGPSRRVWTTSAGGEFTTRAEATAHAKKSLADSLRSSTNLYTEGDKTLEVFKRTLRTPEASVVRSLVSWKIKLTACIATSDERNFEHWLFYGWAAS